MDRQTRESFLMPWLALCQRAGIISEKMPHGFQSDLSIWGAGVWGYRDPTVYLEGRIVCLSSYAFHPANIIQLPFWLNRPSLSSMSWNRGQKDSVLRTPEGPEAEKRHRKLRRSP